MNRPHSSCFLICRIFVCSLEVWVFNMLQWYFSSIIFSSPSSFPMRKPHFRRKCMDHIHVHERCKFARIGHLVVLSYKFKVMISCLVLFSLGFVMICGCFIYLRSSINFLLLVSAPHCRDFFKNLPFVWFVPAILQSYSLVSPLIVTLEFLLQIFFSRSSYLFLSHSYK